MARITVDDCLKRISNRFQLTLAATYRARQLSAGASPLVEANRARFSISSTPGEGTLVEVSFPSTRVLAG